MSTNRRSQKPEFGFPPQAPWEDQTVKIIKIFAVFGIEIGMLVFHYAVYSETLTLMPGGYLIDIAFIGFLFAAVPDAQVNHMIAGFLALASVATPVLGFFYLLRERVFAEPEVFFSYKPHRVYVTVLLLFWSLMVIVELYNVVTLIETYVQNPFLNNQAVKAVRENAGLAYLAAVVIALVNTALALMTALVWTTMFPKREV